MALLHYYPIAIHHCDFTVLQSGACTSYGEVK